MSEKLLFALSVDGQRKVNIYPDGSVEFLGGVTAKQAWKYLADALKQDENIMTVIDKDYPEERDFDVYGWWFDVVKE